MTATTEKLEEKSIAKEIFESFFHVMFAKGHITDEDIVNKAILYTKLSEFIKNTDILFVADYRNEILNAANEYLLKGQHHFSLIFFVMFFEHSINNLIAQQLETKHISNKARVELIRTANMEAKFSWLLELLGMPKFNQHHKKAIINASNERNAFIHYKWNPAQDPLKNEDDKISNLINFLKKSVSYMKKYEAKILYKNNKGKLKNALKND